MAIFKRRAGHSVMLALLFVAMASQAVEVAKPVHDMARMWQTSLARQPLAVGASFDSQGRLWRASVNEGHVVVSHSNDMGKRYSAPVVVNPDAEFVAADGENRPKVLVAANGNVYVSWTRSLETPFSGDVRFSRSVDGGKHFSAPVTVNDNREMIAHRFESMGVNRRGQIYLVWLDKRDASAAAQRGEKYSGISVYSAVSDDEGVSFKANVRVAEHSCECCRTAMAVDRDGVPVVVWRHVFDGSIRDHALARLDGKAALRLSQDNWNVAACPHHGPAISIGEDGVYHTAWFSNAPERRGLFYAYSGDQGKTFSAPLNFGKPAVQAAHPAVLSLGRRVHLVWKEFDGEHTRIVAMHSADGGKSWSAPFALASTADASDSPLLLANSGKAYLSWNTRNEGHRLIEAVE